MFKMDKSGNEIQNFETILKLHSRKKTCPLYDSKNTHIYLSSKIKPQDVISSVSQQLRDIQKADSLKMERTRITKLRSSEFVPVNALSREEVHHQHIHKFETQCMTDTQLIDIVDSVEAMVDVNKGMAEEFETSFCHKHDKLKNTNKENFTKECWTGDQISIEDNVSNFCEIKQFIDNTKEDVVEPLGNNFHDMYDINTDFCKEFETSYYKTHNDIKYISYSKQNVENTLIGEPVNIQFVKETVTNTTLDEVSIHKNESDKKFDASIPNFNPDSYISSLDTNKNMHICDNNDGLINPLDIVSIQESYKAICNDSKMESDKIIKTLCSNKKEDNVTLNKNDITQRFDEDTDTRISLESEEGPRSPIFNRKPKTNSCPLIFALESFEKFESLAMPLIEENLDFEAAKHLINSQIINKELIIDGNKTPVLDESKDNIASVDKNSPNSYHAESSQNFLRKDQINTLKETHTESQTEKRPCYSSEDEILFSSDEKNNYLHNNEDLPMTCHLKTSSYDSEIFDLNKTMFVGFQTGSNKSIQVLKESLDKAKSIFDNIEKQTNENLTLTDLVQIYDENTSNNLNNNLISKQSPNEVKTICSNLCNTEIVLNQSTEEKICMNPEVEFIGFKTANGKSIDISEKALQNCKNIFKDIETEIVHIDGKGDMLNDLNLITKNGKFVGSENANKIIKFSEKSIARPKNIFKDFDLNFNNKSSNKAFESNNSDKKKEYTLQRENCKSTVIDRYLFNIHENIDNEELSIVDQTLLREFENDSIEETLCKRDKLDSNTSDFVGFKTANNKNIEISVTSLKKSQYIFKDIDNITYENFDPGIVRHAENLHDFTVDFELKKNKTHSTKFLVPNADHQGECLNSKKNNIIILNKNDIKHNKKSATEMICLSDKSTSKFGLSKANTCIGAIKMGSYSHYICSKKEKNTYPCVFKNKDKISLDLSIEKYVNKKNFDIGNISSTSAFQGFKTASDKQVNISEEALSKSRNIFQDIITMNTDKDNIMKIERDINNDVKFLHNKSDNIIPSCFSGFKTANNKPVKVSEEALIKTKKIFQNIDMISDVNVKSTDNLDYLDNNSKYSDYNKCSDGLKQKFPFQGFTTASNNVIKVSGKALLNSRKIFEATHVNDSREDIDYKTTPINNVEFRANLRSGLEGFKTASNKAIHVLETALLNANSIFKDIDNDDDNDGKYCDFNHKVTFEGFKIADNKPVTVSKDALLKTRKIFNDIDVISDSENVLLQIGENCENYVKTLKDREANVNVLRNKGSSKGFKTASNKPFCILGDVLAKASKDLEMKYDNFNKENNGTSQRDVRVCKDSAVVIENKAKRDFGVFKGFQTASNKSVEVSDEAIARGRKLFDDINLDIENKDEYKENECFITQTEINHKIIGNSSAKVTNDFGYKTAKNKSMKIFDDSLPKTRQLFGNIDNNSRHTQASEFKPNKDNEVELKNNLINTDNILNTQIISNFEETLHTEDFYKDITPKQSKRSGSPILSCPKAKKRKKFETPYRNDNSTFKIQNIINNNNNKITGIKYTFLENYKKTKVYTLSKLNNINQKNNRPTSLDPYILNFEFDTLLNFEFAEHRNDLTDVRWTTDNVKTCFIESVDSKIIPDGWLDNHLKLILWKLISYEIRFPKTMESVCSVRNVLEQLKYRYDKELYNVERPALRKMLEKDDVSTRTMVLAIVSVNVDGVKINSVSNPSASIELLVTDGWYTIKACVDRMIANFVCNGRITVGSKIATVGAELLNCEQGVSPWEDTSSVRLKLFGNSTRTARWDARLGYHSNRMILSQLSAIDVSGGKVSGTRALVVRLYPALYVERFQDGSTVTRSERLENIHQMKHETDRQMQLEKLYEEVEKEFFEQDSSESEGADCDLKKSLQTGSQINKRIKKSRDPSEYCSHLTVSQASHLQDFTSKRREKMLETLQKRVQDRMQEQGLHAGRNVVTLLKIRVAGFKEADGVGITKAMISIWRPNDAVLDIVKEGTWIDIFNVVPTAMRNSEVHISAGRQSIFHRSKYKEKSTFQHLIEALKRKCFTIKELVQNPTMVTDFNEIDTLGMVFLIDPLPKDFETTKAQFQNVYITDIDRNFICINFWGGIKKFGYENIFASGNIVACSNLQKRAGNTRKSIPHYRATELSVFSETSRYESVRRMMEETDKSFSGINKRKFCEDCVLIKNCARIQQTVSPYRFNTSDHNFTRNKLFIESPLVQADLNLTGLDFESSFKQTDTEISAATLKRKRRVNERITKLEMYGEPPPLSKMFIMNKSKNAGSAYKSPLTSDVCTNDTTEKNNDSPVTTNRLTLRSSPILSMNRRSVVRGGANPVKLNFSTTSVGDDKVESNPFEEEFEASPPLSLD